MHSFNFDSLENKYYNFGPICIHGMTRYPVFFYFVPPFKSDLSQKNNCLSAGASWIDYVCIVISGKHIMIIFILTP